MKNLQLQFSTCVSDNYLKNAKAMCYNADSEVLYFADCNAIYCLAKDSKEVSCILLDLESSIPDCDIVEMDYIVEAQHICITYSSGDIITYNPAEKKSECVGSVESGISNAVWSPSRDLLCVITGHDTFILMTIIFDALVENDLHPSEYGEKNPVSLGWGSKETQFHGSEGKGAAKVKSASIPQPAVPWDDKKCRISWRGDGEYFAISAIDKEYDCRKIRIFTQNGILQYTAELRNGLEQSLCWRPSGNLITCCQQEPNKHKVIFFEKNGLQHGEFDLPYPPNSFAVKELIWNSDSSILAIWGHEINEQSSQFSVTLWTSRNYHWYLKQTLNFGEDEIRSVLWDHQYPYRLHILLTDGRYLQYTWTWSHYHSRSNEKLIDDAIAAVIDNNKILITPFRRMIVPPPMCTYYLQFECAINSVAFAPSRSSQDFCLVLTDGRIAFCSQSSKQNSNSIAECKLTWVAGGGNGFAKVVSPHMCKSICSISWEKEDEIMKYPLSLNHWTWMSNKLFCIGVDPENGESVLLCIDIPDDLSSCGNKLSGKCVARIKEPVIWTCSDEEGTLASLFLKNREVWKYNLSEITPWQHHIEEKPLVLPSQCLNSILWHVGDKTIIIWMNNKFVIYCNDVVLPEMGTSFVCHSKFLLLTTCSNLLSCYSQELIKKICFNNEKITPSDIPHQEVEDGAAIVMAIPRDTRLILQMPRGNLEVIHPRPLVLSTIQRLLDEFEYAKAFDIIKRNRIDMNIIFDHDHTAFLDHVSEFLKQLPSPADINIFLASLRNEDVCSSIYKFAYEQGHVPLPEYMLPKDMRVYTLDFHIQSGCKKVQTYGSKNTQQKIENCSEKEKRIKKDIICEAVRNALSSMESKMYFSCVVATYAQQTIPKLEEAVIVIKNYNGEDREKIIDESLKLLACLADVNELYDVALSTYDFEIAIMVAERSNMDPKEYMPFLNELSLLEENYRKYEVDMHLQNYVKALQHISKCKDRFEECMNLIKSKKLYNEALALFDPYSSEWKKIQEAHGDYLAEENHFVEAGLMYLACFCFEKALKSFCTSCDRGEPSHQLAISVARVHNYSEEAMSALCEKMARNFMLFGKHHEAAHLFLHYCHDVKSSIRAYIDCQDWISAYETIINNGEMSMITSHLVPELSSFNSVTSENLNHTKEQIISYAERLNIARKRKVESSMALALAKVSMFQFDDISAVSTDTKSASSSSSITFHSRIASLSNISKATNSNFDDNPVVSLRRKKKYKITEGSWHEDWGLMFEMKKQIKYVDDLKDNFFNCLTVMVTVNLFTEARELQKTMKAVVGTIDTYLPMIWDVRKIKSFDDLKPGPEVTANDISDLQEKKVAFKSIVALSLSEVPAPTWRKMDNIYLKCLD